ncbi:MAG: hypothetical protein ONB48_17460 [candidate division KSB1 bacterium]|nr:hypothetical protein [candidate division KSB1 bacterium]MDZ7275268.1 hypothetical protein [candidate division KSB1 bacterium]MDZ7287436.1 hypothetical protein [candidate division KSB1 bacterium]MDZ7299550.1 hypothetical protein [candidate division KSB1 bacterium]MDZ7308008.1 hypothetical protein [candidate division KSB1 bacterium]
MFKFKSRELDLIEILPPSSEELKNNLEIILSDSERWNAALASVDQQTGTYRIVLEGRLREAESNRR